MKGLLVLTEQHSGFLGHGHAASIIPIFLVVGFLQLALRRFRRLDTVLGVLTLTFGALGVAASTLGW